MPVATHTAGGHSTLDVLIGVAVLILALAGAGLLLGWLWRFALKRRRKDEQVPQIGGLIARPRVRTGRARATRVDPGSAPAGPENSNPGSAAQAEPSSTPPRASGQAEAPPAARPAIPGARMSPEQLEPLGQDVDNSRRLAASETRVAPVLGSLPADRWFVERYVLVAGHRVPFLILGETGVFVLWAIPGLPQWRELGFFDRIARHIESALPGYAGEVHPGVCRASKPDMKPRWWCRPGEPGVWVMGLNWLIPWLEHFGPENGLGVKDLERLRELAGPRWGRPVRDVPLSAHIPTIG